MKCREVGGEAMKFVNEKRKRKKKNKQEHAKQQPSIGINTSSVHCFRASKIFIQKALYRGIWTATVGHALWVQQQQEEEEEEEQQQQVGRLLAVHILALDFRFAAVKVVQELSENQD